MILHHLTGRGQSLEAAALQLPHPLYAFIRGGYLAVTTFFVLSGFVLARNYAATRWTGGNLLHYWIGRVARVYPVYALSLAVVAPFIAADGVPGKAPLVAAHGLLLQAWLGHIPVSWNTPAWSLSCEIFFYLSFPPLAAALYPPTWRKTLAAAAAACVLTRLLWALGVSDGIKPLIHLSRRLLRAPLCSTPTNRIPVAVSAPGSADGSRTRRCRVVFGSESSQPSYTARR